MTNALVLSCDSAERFRRIRAITEDLAEPLSAEDACAQSMPDASPAKWHLAHTSWFFETFLLAQLPGFAPFDARYGYLFNSYYEAIGARHPRPSRGLLTRPPLDEIMAYRASVSERVVEMLDDRGAIPGELAFVLELGLHHEQQHQELILTDIKHLFGSNPLSPVYRTYSQRLGLSAPPLEWMGFGGGVTRIGHTGEDFAFDNELPSHRVFLEPFALTNRLVTNGEFIAFMHDAGYSRPEFWLADGFRMVTERGLWGPEYWQRVGTDRYDCYTLAGRRPVLLDEPVCHVSYYEADAYARWAGSRLPTEEEWEHVAAQQPVEGNFQESGFFQPTVAPSNKQNPLQLFGDVWEWTASAYAPYPGFRAAGGAIGEYNGKFMCNQMVLRGGSCATPRSHARASYRNFFPAAARWQFTGIRLARSL